eukprot:CAMPEP_0181313570 /NCGR_PEP_ID=MMETSP1101-20121128/14318_1 /TAXON_ID=46948 /ORGANISM="Rhodomonas abbreviata, Strain Caron Lab Isolate" /LENGTH=409 /DNA_ID=CAMNT_0023420531 /DNA_START=46 /DNA_END=1275 /DNA_ORIENTATION=+
MTVGPNVAPLPFDDSCGSLYTGIGGSSVIEQSLISSDGSFEDVRNQSECSSEISEFSYLEQSGGLNKEFIMLLEDRTRIVRELTEKALQKGDIARENEQLKADLAEYKQAMVAMIEVQNEMIQEIDCQKNALASLSVEKSSVDHELKVTREFIVQLELEHGNALENLRNETLTVQQNDNNTVFLQKEVLRLQEEVAILRKKSFDQLAQCDLQCMKLMDQVANLQESIEELRTENWKLMCSQSPSNPSPERITEETSEETVSPPSRAIEKQPALLSVDLELASHRHLELAAIDMADTEGSPHDSEAPAPPPRNPSPPSRSFSGSSQEQEGSKGIETAGSGSEFPALFWISSGDGLPVVQLTAEGEITIARSKLPTVWEEESEEQGAEASCSGNLEKESCSSGSSTGSITP